MTFDNEYPYLDYEFDDNFLGWYENEGIIQITEHSRQIRTLLSFKCATIRYFYRQNTEISINLQKSNFFETKNSFELLALQFIKLIKKVKAITGVLEEGIQIIQNNVAGRDKNAKAHLMDLNNIVEKLYVKIHFFSEQDIHKYPRFLLTVIRVAYEVCKVQKCLKGHFSEFYQELGENYFKLEKDLLVMIPREVPQKHNIKNKQLGEALLK